MKMFYVGVWQNEKKPAFELCAETCIPGNRLMQNGKKNFLFAIATRIVPEIKPGMHQVITDESLEQYVLHAFGREGICAIVFTDKEYPERVAGQLLRKVCDEFLNKYTNRDEYINATKPLTYDELKVYIQKYQDPQQEDILSKVQNELVEVQKVAHNTISALMGRGEKLDDLVAKSDVLSAQSKMFYTQAKKQNSCCIVM